MSPEQIEALRWQIVEGVFDAMVKFGYSRETAIEVASMSRHTEIEVVDPPSQNEHLK